MRAALWATFAIASCIASGGCGGDSSVPSTASRAGSQPIPSSQPTAVPASGSPQRPMFAGASHGDRSAAVAGSPRMVAFREEVERREQQGPQRLQDPQERGRELAEAMQTAAAEAVAADPTTTECEQAWVARAAMRDHLGIQGQDSRAEFITACRSLPEDERHCMSPAYVTNHQDECHALQERQLEVLRRQGHIRDRDRPAPR